METAIAALIVLTVVLFGVLTIVQGHLSSQDAILESWREMEERTGERARTRISNQEGDEIGAQGFDVRVILKNTGQTRLADFSHWDVIVQYYDEYNNSHIKRLSYSEGNPEDDQWALTGIFQETQTSTPEFFDPGIFNTEEEAWFHLKLNPKVGAATNNWVVMSTPNGVTAQVVFEVLPSTLYVVDGVDLKVYKYRDDGTFLGSGPLDAQNQNASGITTNYTNFWTTDITGNRAYQYTAGFSLLTSWALDGNNDDGDGVTTDGSNIWVVNHHQDKRVYKYTMDGTVISSFLPGNDHATGMTTDGNYIWVVSHGGDGEAFKYDMNGNPVSSFPLTDTNTDPEGITTDGSNIWVVDNSDDKVYKYDMGGTLVSSFSLIAANADPMGITVTPR